MDYIIGFLFGLFIKKIFELLKSLAKEDIEIFE
jgi:hypothetical protein